MNDAVSLEEILLKKQIDELEALLIVYKENGNTELIEITELEIHAKVELLTTLNA